jgi:hypothetical protein
VQQTRTHTHTHTHTHTQTNLIAAACGSKVDRHTGARHTAARMQHDVARRIGEPERPHAAALLAPQTPHAGLERQAAAVPCVTRETAEGAQRHAPRSPHQPEKRIWSGRGRTIVQQLSSSCSGSGSGSAAPAILARFLCPRMRRRATREIAPGESLKAAGEQSICMPGLLRSEHSHLNHFRVDHRLPDTTQPTSPFHARFFRTFSRLLSRRTRV